MRISVERLRNWLIAGAIVLMLVIAGFLGYARYRTHRFLAGLPGKLGIDIRRETNGYTYSQSIGGKTVMTLHASKAVEHNNGKLTLHDVRMVLYGRKQDRADRISGAEFEYDQASGVVRAVGEVHIDLEAPSHDAGVHGDAHGTGTALAPGTAEDAEAESKRLIHVRTSGLVYLQKLGIAATDQPLEFSFNGMTGNATGAEYNADTGIVILESDVRSHGLQHGRPVALAASHAELDRQSQQALLTEAKFTAPGQTARGDHAIVHLRSDGSPERIEAEGHVAMSGQTAGTVTAPHLDVMLSAASQAQSAHLFGGVEYADVTALRERRGQAKDARIAFDAAGHPEHVVLSGAVHTNERERTPSGAAGSSTVRDATAETMTINLIYSGSTRRETLHDVEAHTAAHLRLIANAGSPLATQSELSGDLLQGHFTGEGKTAQLTTVHGAGNTFLQRADAKGAEQTSAGDVLDVVFRPAKRLNAPRPAAQRPAASESTAALGGADAIARATQTGHVVLTSRTAAKPGAKETASSKATSSRATAELAVYNGDTDHLTLTGHAALTDEGSTISADRIVMEHASGDATADGTVKVNYLQPNAAEPVHVLADRAELKHEAQRALFYGTAARAARLWQGASQVEAPVLDLEQKERRLTARAAAATVLPAVHAVLVGSAAVKPAAGSAPKPPPTGKPGEGHAAGRPSVVRVTSRSMVYEDGTRQVDFAGDVRVDDADGILRAHQATAFLQAASAADPAPAANPAPAVGTAASKEHPAKIAGSGIALGGSVERIVAEGAIEMEQPGRRVSGERLVYTASDATFVLTGTQVDPPKLIDEVQGTVTGSSLRFRTGDDSVTVLGSGEGSSGKRVHTVTRVKQK